MIIQFHKISDEAHTITVTRSDRTISVKSLNSRSFLFHDLAHFVLEIEIPLKSGFWGSVADGADLDSANCDGADLLTAERIAGPFQTLVKNLAPASSYQHVLDGALTDCTHTDKLASAIHERVRQVRGMWRATPYGDKMELTWPY
ncbi:MAG: hypothetical protein AAF541_12170 [Pseudomonadota bacterium]